LWIIIDQKVYDVTSFVDDHPGGVEAFLSLRGEDGLQKFDSMGHS